MKKALSVCTCLCTFSVWEIQFHVFCEPQMLDGEHCNLVSIFSPWLEGNLIIFNHLPKAHLGQHLKRTLATFCCSLAFINTVNFQHFFQVQDALFKNHNKFFGCFFFAVVPDGLKVTSIQRLLSSLKLALISLNSFDDIVSH